jgi:A/G-specific adenine glycosylase
VSRGRALLAWYHRSARDLPWRHTRDPYRILVSEVMLQQTQAARVAGHYERFTAQFPTVESLARAPLSEVLEAWSGLGYTVRARRLRDAARIIVAEGWPTTAPDLERLPGVGPYTAAAVASFAFGARAVVVDTNVRRVLSRWAGTALGGAALRAAADEAAEGDAASWNQAVMELGATLCRPRLPRCGECPVSAWCTDPSIYRPPPRQGRFEGSHRQVRSAVLRGLGPDWTPFDHLAATTGHHRSAVLGALESLSADELVDLADGKARVAD